MKVAQFLAPQVAAGLLLSAVLNAPSALASAAGPRIAVVLLTVLTAGALLANAIARPTANACPVPNQVATEDLAGPVTLTELPPHLLPMVDAIEKRAQWTRLWVPLTFGAVALGSVVGALAGGWWLQVLLGALGFVVASAWYVRPMWEAVRAWSADRPG